MRRKEKEMRGLRMRLMILACALLVASQFTGCGSSSKERQPAEVDRSPQARPANPDLLSTDGELFLLSTYFGVCVRRAGILRATFSNGMLNPHYTTSAEFIGGAGRLKISVGKFGMYPGTVLKDVPVTSPPRRIQIGHDRFNSFVLVSDFEGAGNNLVSIDYDEADAEAQAEIMRLANNVVACHVTAVSAKPKPK